MLTEDYEPDSEHKTQHLKLTVRSLHPSIKTIWRLQLSLWTLFIFLGVFFLYDLPGWFSGAQRTFPAFRLSGVILVGGMLFAMIWPAVKYKYFKFELLEKELYIEQGPFTRVKTIVPLRRVQHLDVSQNLLEREFELGKLIVYTAGTQNNRVELPGLVFEEAEHLRETVRSFITESAV